MIDIFKGLIDMIILAINTLFNMPIQISSGVNIKFGFIAIGFVLFFLAMYFILNLLGINFGGDDD